MYRKFNDKQSVMTAMILSSLTPPENRFERRSESLVLQWIFRILSSATAAIHVFMSKSRPANSIPQFSRGNPIALL